MDSDLVNFFEDGTKFENTHHYRNLNLNMQKSCLFLFEQDFLVNWK